MYLTPDLLLRYPSKRGCVYFNIRLLKAMELRKLVFGITVCLFLGHLAADKKQFTNNLKNYNKSGKRKNKFIKLGKKDSSVYRWFCHKDCKNVIRMLNRLSETRPEDVLKHINNKTNRNLYRIANASKKVQNENSRNIGKRLLLSKLKLLTKKLNRVPKSKSGNYENRNLTKYERTVLEFQNYFQIAQNRTVQSQRLLQSNKSDNKSLNANSTTDDFRILLVKDFLRYLSYSGNVTNKTRFYSKTGVRLGNSLLLGKNSSMNNEGKPASNGSSRKNTARETGYKSTTDTKSFADVNIILKSQPKKVDTKDKSNISIYIMRLKNIIRIEDQKGKNNKNSIVDPSIPNSYQGIKFVTNKQVLTGRRRFFEREHFLAEVI